MSKWKHISGRVVSARVSEGVYTYLQDMAAGKGMTVSVYVRQILTNGVEKHKGVYVSKG